MGWLIKIALIEGRFVIILLNLIKLGFIKTKSETMRGFSVVFGFWKIECQINLSTVTKEKVAFNEVGRA